MKDYRIHYEAEAGRWPHTRAEVVNNIVVFSFNANLIGKSIEQLTADNYRCIEIAPMITNREWQHLDEVTALFKRDYTLNYSRPAGSKDPTPWQSCSNPSYQHADFILNSFQIIWNRANDREIWLNHGYPDVYKTIREKLTAAGFILLENNPNK